MIILMTVQERKHWIAFSCFTQIGPKRFFLLRKYFGKAEKAWKARKETLLKIGLKEKLVLDFIKFRESFDPPSYFLRLKKLGIETVTFEDKDYPENLKNIDDAPFLLYILGEILAKDSLSIGVVGTRKITSYGKEVTEKLVSDLVASGLTIVSGLAFGVDSVAHNAALSLGGRTIGVWAGGLDSVIPGYRKYLVEKIVKSSQGAVVSEFPLGFHPRPETFPQRNRIISGLSLGVLVTEAAEDSGSLITASWAAQQGREVFAVPGPITSQQTAGTAKLLKTGAKLVYNVKDILDELEIERRAKKEVAREILPENKEEEIILKMLENEVKHIDQIIKETGMDSGKIASILTMMEIKGKIKNLGGMVYALAR
ncbi:MAG: DNA-processing protein DprA [Patescibacteria group bacterium]